MKVFLPALLVLAICISSCDLDRKEAYDPIAQFDEDVKKIDAYLAATGQTAMTDPSGVRIILDAIGIQGLPPKRNHTVNVKLKGTLLDGTVFEDRTAKSILENCMPGLVEGLEVLPEGSAATLIIPSVLAYGKEGSSLVPPHSIVVYEVELLDVEIPQVEIDQFKQDTAAIRQFLEQSEIEAQDGLFGIKYVLTEQGSGEVPNWYSKIRVHYTGRVLATQEAFYIGTVGPTDNFSSRVVDYLPGLQIAFQSFPAGSKVTVYIPSTLAFGAEALGDGKVPAHSNVSYEMDNLEVIAP